MRICEPTESSTLIESFRTLLKDTMGKPNLFIMPYDSNNEEVSNRFERVVSCLKEDFDISIYELSPSACNLSDCNNFSNNFLCKCIAIDSGKTEGIRDIIKEALWPTFYNGTDSPNLNSILSANEDTDRKSFTLAEYGLFVPYKTRKYDTIRMHSFSHKPVFYRYRLALDKIQRLPAKLESYLQHLFTDCPNHLFNKSEFRASARTCDGFNIKVSMEDPHNYDLTRLAEKSLSFNQFKARHENLQKYFLLNDPCTVACEVPLWLEACELKDYLAFFNTDDVLTGHIDIVRYEKNGKIGIWDYKPKAIIEMDASLQVSLYALMLSLRTGICLKNSICGYFNETDVFLVDPILVINHCLLR